MLWSGPDFRPLITTPVCLTVITAHLQMNQKWFELYALCWSYMLPGWRLQWWTGNSCYCFRLWHVLWTYFGLTVYCIYFQAQHWYFTVLTVHTVHMTWLELLWERRFRHPFLQVTSVKLHRMYASNASLAWRFRQHTNLVSTQLLSMLRPNLMTGMALPYLLLAFPHNLEQMWTIKIKA